METSLLPDWATRGLRGSGYAVSYVHVSTTINSYVLEKDRVFCIAVPGKPCEILLAFTARGAEEFFSHLTVGLRELRELAEQDQ